MWSSKLWARIGPLTHLRQTRGFRGVHSVEQFRMILERERARADRNEHQFSIVVFDAVGTEANSAEAQYLVHVLRKRIRFTDQLGWFDNRRIAILLPETPAEGARTLAADVCQIPTASISPPKYTIHTYPSKKSTSDKGHLKQLSLAECCPKWKTTTSRNSTTSAEQSARAYSSSERKCPTPAPAHDKIDDPLEQLFCRPLPFWKRAMDIVGATFALIVFSPIMVAIAIAVKLTSKGPVIFKQQRAGLGGRPFTFYKFRSMVVDAEARKDDLLEQNERTGPAFKMTNDPRVTRIGTFLRKWSLDELPQLFNVLKGDLSLVGPRPLPMEEASQHNRWQDRRLSITPGITCLWQVYARHDKSFDRWARLDIEYILRQSPLLDVNILLKTLPAVLSRKGAC